MQAHGGDSGKDNSVRGWVKAGKKFGAKASKGAWTWVTEVGGKLDDVNWLPSSTRRGSRALGCCAGARAS